MQWQNYSQAGIGDITFSQVYFSHSQVYEQSEYETCDLRIALLRMAYDHAIFIRALNFYVMEANTMFKTKVN